MKKVYFFGLLFFFSFTVFGQFSISGFVKDELQLPFSNLEVTIEQLQVSVTTDILGFYEFKSIPNGEYALSFNYLFDKEYRKVIVNNQNTSYSLSLKRRINFEEITIVQSILNRNHSLSKNSIGIQELESEQSEKDIPYILQKLGNVQIQSDAGNGVGYTDVRIRGIDPQHVQYNLNGIPLNDAESSRTYLVDVPDIVNSTDEINVYSGYVPGRSGPGAFGAAVDLFTNKLHFTPFAKVKSRFASYHTNLFSVQANTGLFEDSYNLEIRLSSLSSNGFIDRSSSKLKSFGFCAVKIKPNYSIRLNLFNGIETTEQAWNGLPYTYFDIDSLFRYNSAGTQKNGIPYNNEIDHYSQTHTQLFYKHSLGDYTMQFTGNFTKGRGYYENYKASQSLEKYGLSHKDTNTSDLIRQKWLDNYFFYSCLGIERAWHRKIYTYLATSFSTYSGDHFGRVIWTELSEVKGLYNNYYNNTGLKNELGLLARFSYQWNEQMNTGLDFQWRNISYQISGTDDVYHLVNGIHRNSTLFSPKVFTQVKIWPELTGDLSYSYYQREPFRDDILNNPNLKNESLNSLDIGLQYLHEGIKLKVNLFRMNYRDYLTLSGKLSDTGDPLHVNLSSARRQGIEWSFQVQAFSKLQFYWNGLASKNKAKTFERIIPIYDNNFNLTGYGKTILNQVDLAFSPKFLSSAGFDVHLLGKSESKESIVLNGFVKFVGSQFLDISQANKSLLPEYLVVNSKLTYTKRFHLFKATVFAQINNLLNKKYSTHGWYSPYTVTGTYEPGSIPYEGIESSGVLFSKGLYPQALRHFSFGIDLAF